MDVGLCGATNRSHLIARLSLSGRDKFCSQIVFKFHLSIAPGCINQIIYSDRHALQYQVNK